MNDLRQVSITILRLFLDAVEGVGLDRQALLDGSGIEADLLEETEARIALRDFERVFQNAAELSGDPAIGLHAGEQVQLRPHAVNLFGYLMLSSATVLDGLRRVARYQCVLTDRPWVALEEESDVIRVVANVDAIDPGFRIIHGEYLLALILGITRWVSAEDIRPLECRYQHRARTDRSEYERVMRCGVRFGEAMNEMRFAPEALARPSIHHDRVMEQLHVDFADWHLAHSLEKRGVASHVRKVLSERLEEGAPDLEEVARQLGMGARSLQRRLTTEGTSFRHVLESLRRDLARVHLEDLGTPVAEVAYLTGFSEVSAFSRAARRWFGRPPGRMRRGAGPGDTAGSRSAASDPS